jgi:hypothetical protein
MAMAAAGFSSKSHPSSASTRTTSLTRKLAAVAGTAGAAAIGASEAQAVVYTPTAGVAAAQGIPGFSFVDASNVTLGALRPPATDGQQVGWDVDGSGPTDFTLQNSTTSAFLAGYAGAAGVGRSFVVNGGDLKQLTAGSVVNAGVAWDYSIKVTSSQQKVQVSSAFQTNNNQANPPGQFGFRFTNASDTYYGWGSLALDFSKPMGQGFVITEAYYNTTPGGAINVGAVPQAVPEPSSMALLGLGAAGVAAWRRKGRTSPVD